MRARDEAQRIIYVIIDPFVGLLVKTGVTPNVITTTGLALNILAAIVLIIGGEQGKQGDISWLAWGCGIVLFAGLFDMLDGQVARKGNMASRFGALYDSVLDRYSELIMFLGICYFLVSHHYLLTSLITFFALVGSMMVSYVRARAEGTGIECKGGLMQRPERIVAIGLSGLICGIVSATTGGNQRLFFDGVRVIETISIFTIPMVFVAIFSNITAINRLMNCRDKLK